MVFIENCFYRISVKALILDSDKRFLLTQEDNGLWELPGGGLDFGEKPQAGLAREVKEEMGVTITYVADNPSYFLTDKTKTGRPYANIIYVARISSLDFTPSAECVAVRFFTQKDVMKEQVFPNVAIFAGMYNPNHH